MPNRDMRDESRKFAVSIVEICRVIKERKKEAVLVNQLLRAGTSIGANLFESKYAQSTPDFVSKLQIALKECYETEYWLEILHETESITDDEYKSLIQDCAKHEHLTWN